VASVSDILIRDVPEATVMEIDRRARNLGISRNEYLRRWLNQDIDPAIAVTVDDLQRVGRIAGDLADPMRQAWS
jgi:hypothetical protein